MKRGALIFAFNNQDIDYVEMAKWSAQRIHRHLAIPVSIVTNVAVRSAFFEKVIKINPDPPSARFFTDLNKNVEWYNANRTDAYHLTPYDQTLVLDADYIVASNRIAELFEVDQDFLCHRWAYDVSMQTERYSLNWFGRNNMPMSWATVMLFKKTQYSSMIFDVMNMVKQNWNHYRNLYVIGRSPYRNDHALSIALNIVNGHTVQRTAIPWQLTNIDPGHSLTQLDLDEFRIEYRTSNQKRAWITTKNMDLHAMGKTQLGEIVANNS